MLIDAVGSRDRDSTSVRSCGPALRRWDSEDRYLAITHAHRDHLGGPPRSSDRSPRRRWLEGCGGRSAVDEVAELSREQESGRLPAAGHASSSRAGECQSWGGVAADRRATTIVVLRVSYAATGSSHGDLESTLERIILEERREIGADLLKVATTAAGRRRPLRSSTCRSVARRDFRGTGNPWGHPIPRSGKASGCRSEV